MIDLFKKQDNIIDWQSCGHHLRKSIIINHEQILEAYHDASGILQVGIISVDDFCEREDMIIPDIEDKEEILTHNMQVCVYLYTTTDFCLARLKNGRLVFVSFETDDFIIL